MQFEYTEIPADVNLKYVMVTPKLAMELLNRNEQNRKIRKTVSRSYEADMRSGRWCQLPSLVDPIIVDWDGNLRNGQHRLTAVVAYGKPVNMWVVWDADPCIYDYLDGGEKRRAADQLSDDIKNKPGVAAIARFGVALTEHGVTIQSAITGNVPGRNGRVTRQEIVEYVRKHNSLLQEVHAEGTRVANAIVGKKSVPYMLPGFIARYIGLGEEYKAFAQELGNSVSYVDVVQLCKGTIQRAAMQSNGRLSANYIVGTILTAFDAYYFGKRGRSLNKQEKYLQKYSALAKARYMEETEL